MMMMNVFWAAYMLLSELTEYVTIQNNASKYHERSSGGLISQKTKNTLLVFTGHTRQKMLHLRKICLEKF